MKNRVLNNWTILWKRVYEKLYQSTERKCFYGVDNVTKFIYALYFFGGVVAVYVKYI